MAAGLNTKGKMEITELDFDNIKSNLKTYLKGQSTFTDYDFEGSGMNILLDTLAYNTHYNAFMANMLANEMFLDTAVKRNSVTSHAKALGYTPTSVKAPIAYLKVQVNDANTATTDLPEGYVFTTTVDGVSYQFVNISARSVTPSAGLYIFGDDTTGIPVYEGTWVTTKHTVDLTDVDQKFLISNENADISTLVVQIQTSASDSTTETWTSSSSLTEVKAESKAYFQQETVDNQWEVYFGDDVVGKALVDGNIVILKYIVTNKDAANGATTFAAGANISGFGDITITTIGAASGGADAETLDSIKHNAPFSYAAQNRAVTAADYKTLVPTLYANVKSISVWGGENNNPAIYGKVFISIQPNTGSTITTSVKTSIVNQLEDYNVVSTTPEIVDPETTNIIPVVNFKFNQNVTAESSTSLASLVTTAITNFSSDSLEKHEAMFRFSQFSTLIDDVDPSILSNITTLKISKTFKPTTGSGTRYDIDFANPLYNPHRGHKASTTGTGAGGILESTGFKYTGDSTVWYYEDDGAGNVKAYNVSGQTKTYKAAPVGTITYSTGELVLSKEDIASVEDYDGATQTSIRLTVESSSNDIVPVRNQVLSIDTTNMSITGEADTIAAGTSTGASDYNTVTSHN